MGNANTQHVSASDVTAGARKKSKSVAGVEPVDDAALHFMHPRTASVGSRATATTAIAGKMMMANAYDEAMIGPVDITPRAGNKSCANQSSSQRARAATEVTRRPMTQRQMSANVTANAAAAAAAGGGDKESLRVKLEGGQNKMPTIFKYGGKDAKEVFVCGTFNNWSKMRMNRSTKDFMATVELQEGEHEYRFLVDGEWLNDKTTETVESTDGSGAKNNLLRVQKGDFNAFDALDMDSEAVNKLSRRALGENSFRYSDEFCQDAPTQNVFEHRSGPPILPPHLLQVILNKDTPLSCEPTLLPEPNHVMINHLYALSIKDGVMVLSATNRYRKKYVTTLLYKPMGTRMKTVAAEG